MSILWTLDMSLHIDGLKNTGYRYRAEAMANNEYGRFS